MVRELLRKMEEQQKTLLEQVDRLQRRLDGARQRGCVDRRPASCTADNARCLGAGSECRVEYATAVTDAASTSAQPASVAAPQANDERYRDGIIIWKTPTTQGAVPAEVQQNTQLRYLNTLVGDDTFTDHLGVVREVNKRNDITVNRSMFILRRLHLRQEAGYSLTVWTSAGAASIVVAGNIGWQFNKRLTLRAGYTGVPGSRSLVNTFPYFTATDRSMADNFFRPGFTQGVWATGELGKGLNYIAFVGNALNSINISAAKIDTHLLASGSLWWEPLGKYGEPGKTVNMYDDYFAKKGSHSNWYIVYTKPGGPFFKSRSIKS